MKKALNNHQWRFGEFGVCQMRRTAPALPLAFLLFAFFLAVSGPSDGAGLSFPSENVESRDPTGRYAVAWERAGSTERRPHRLFLKDLSSGRISRLLEFDRQVDVLWAPDGRFVAVTDWTASNISEILLFEPGKTWATNLADALYSSLPKLPEIADNDHVYFEALSWDGPRKLLFKVFGHGATASTGFEAHFGFETTGKVSEVKPGRAGP